MNKYVLNILFLVFTLCGSAVMAKENEDEVNYLELASLMLKDNNIERAEIALSQVDKDVEDFEWQRFHVLNGLLQVRKGDHQAAIDAFLAAKKLGEVDSVINVYLAQSAFATEQYQLAIDALNDAGKAVERIPSVYHMRGQAHWLLKEHEMALAVMDQASQIFPEDASFSRRKIFYLIELGLNSTAAELGQQYLEQQQADASDYVAIGNALRASGNLILALRFLERAQLKFPQNADVSKALAATYISNQSYDTAANLVHRLALTDNQLMSEAAELYRRSGQRHLALTLNSTIENQEQKLKQRLGLLIELENYEQAANMEDDIKRVRIDSDENILYAMAYALFKVGDYPKAERYLSRITDTQLFQKAVEIRKIMADCADEAWRCQ
jgi:tetratricopeptide (TPR) repeat protein